MSAPQTYAESFTVEGTPTVEVGNVRGTITVRPGPDGVVKIEAVQHTDYGARVKIRQREDGSIAAKVKNRSTLGFFTGLSSKTDRVDFTVTTPANTNLSIKAVSAHTNVEGITGELLLKSVSGKIEGADISGPLHLKTVSGTASLMKSSFPTLTAKTVSGSLKLQTPIGGGPYNLSSVSGSVELLAGDAPAGRIYFKSISGSAAVNGSQLMSSGRSRGEPRKAVYMLSEDGPEITFNSVSGSLAIFTDGDFVPPGVAGVRETASPAPAPVSAGAQKDVMDVLEKIASGELSVDDGVEALGS